MNTTESAPGKVLTKLSDLDELAIKSEKKKKLVLAVAQDAHSLEAVTTVVQRGLVEAILNTKELVETGCRKQGQHQCTYSINW